MTENAPKQAMLGHFGGLLPVCLGLRLCGFYGSRADKSGQNHTCTQKALYVGVAKAKVQGGKVYSLNESGT